MSKTFDKWLALNEEWMAKGYSVFACVKGDRFSLIREWTPKGCVLVPMLFVPPFLSQELNEILAARLDKALENGTVRFQAVRHGTNGKGNDLFPIVELS